MQKMIKPFKPTPRPNPDTAYVPLRKQSPTQAPKMPVAPKAAAAAAASVIFRRKGEDSQTDDR